MLKFFTQLFNDFGGTMPSFNNLKPIVVVLGATGTGKSKLSLEIASKYNGEIISADSMQVYKGLDIVTNKVTSEERSLVPHHLLDFLNPLEKYNVVDFRNEALSLINDLHEEGKVPVIVGGTHYYVESLLWNVLIQSGSVNSSDISENCKLHPKSLNNQSDSEINMSSGKNKCEMLIESDKLSEISYENEKVKCNEEEFSIPVSQNVEKVECGSGSSANESVVTSDTIKLSMLRSHQDLDNISNEDLLTMLQKVDPEIASSYHPNNRRKIIRSLEVWAQTGVRHSEHLHRQSEEVGGADLGGKRRFPNVAVLWVTCEQATLEKRLDRRVDAMLEAGLLHELQHFHHQYNAPRLEPLLPEGKQDAAPGPSKTGPPTEELYTQGIFQSIGFKEFHEFLLLDQRQRQSDEGQKLYREGVEMMKLRTRQYSRRQLKWIRNRFFKRERERIPVYSVDATDPSQWSVNVTPIAEEVVGAVLDGRTPQTPPATLEKPNDAATKCTTGDKTRHHCEVCDRIFIGTHQWQEHLESRKHNRILKRKQSCNKEKETTKKEKVS